MRYYVMPGQDELCERLAVEKTSGTQIAPEDLRTCRTYRQAVLREFIKRRPGLYSRDWLSGLLGVSVVTSRRYTQQDASFEVEATYQCCRVNWSNVASLIPPDLQDARPGSFIEDSEGNRYPPIQPAAKRLLGRSKKLFFKWRTVNHYAYAKSGAAGEAEAVILGHAAADLPKSDNQPIPALSHTTAAPLLLATPPTPKPPTSAPAAQAEPDYRHPLPEARLEQAAQCVYTRMGQTTGKPSLSLAKARALVSRYGAFAVENTLDMVQQRANLRSPVGFLTRMLEAYYTFDQPMSAAEIFAAEQAYQITRAINPRRALSWKNACALALEHGQVAVETALRTLREREQVRNPAGLLIKLLRSGQEAAHHAPDDEQYAEHVYRTLQAKNPRYALTLKTARKLVESCGRKAVEDAMRLLEQRRDVQNPAGFLITVLRANDLVSRKERDDQMTPEERQKVWIEQLKNSPYASFYANAEDFLDAGTTTPDDSDSG